jgi:hypothetical protein
MALTLEVDRAKLQQAPAIDRAQLRTQLGQATFTQQINTYYGVQASGNAALNTTAGIGAAATNIYGRSTNFLGGRTNMFPTGRTNLFGTNQFQRPSTFPPGRNLGRPEGVPPGPPSGRPDPGLNNPGSAPTPPQTVPNTTPGTPPSERSPALPNPPSRTPGTGATP